MGLAMCSLLLCSTRTLLQRTWPALSGRASLLASLYLHLLPVINGQWNFFSVFSFRSSVLSSSHLAFWLSQDRLTLRCWLCVKRGADQSVMPPEVTVLCQRGFLFPKGFAKGILCLWVWRWKGSGRYLCWPAPALGLCAYYPKATKPTDPWKANNNTLHVLLRRTNNSGACWFLIMVMWRCTRNTEAVIAIEESLTLVSHKGI